jgi:hypothetical protein
MCGRRDSWTGTHLLWPHPPGGNQAAAERPAFQSAAAWTQGASRAGLTLAPPRSTLLLLLLLLLPGLPGT